MEWDQEYTSYLGQVYRKGRKNIVYAVVKLLHEFKIRRLFDKKLCKIVVEKNENKHNRGRDGPILLTFIESKLCQETKSLKRRRRRTKNRKKDFLSSEDWWKIEDSVDRNSIFISSYEEVTTKWKNSSQTFTQTLSLFTDQCQLSHHGAL